MRIGPAAPAMAAKIIGKGSKYAAAYVDVEGNPFDLPAYIDHDTAIVTSKSSGGRDLRALVLREGVVTALAGVLVGAAGSLVGMRLLESLLLPRTAADPWLWVLVPVSACSACW